MVLGTGTRYWLGGMVFELGWAIVGACPGPLFALIGGGLTVMVGTLASAIGGTWVYGALRARLPHRVIRSRRGDAASLHRRALAQQRSCDMHNCIAL